MRGQAAVAVLVLSACTALFDPAQCPVVDRDNDNVEDRDDNCPDIPNADQSDFDFDLMGERSAVLAP